MATFPALNAYNWYSDLKAYIDAYGAATTNMGVSLGVSNGTDDTSSINAILVANAGQVVRGFPGQNYKISAPLVIRSATTLDMTGCTVTLNAGSNCNMINNLAVSTANRSVNVTTVVSSTTVTATSGTFSSADVGRCIVIPGGMAANGGTTGPLCVTLSTFTDATHMVMSAPATAVVTGVASNIYVRDVDICVRGGIWDRGANGGVGVVQHSIRFRRCDRLTVEDIRFTSTSGKYAVNVGSCTRFWIDAISLNAASDGIHLNGDCQYGVVNRIDGKDGDDFVALVAREAPTYPYEDVAGDIRDIVIDTLTMSGGLAPVKLLGGAGCVISGIKIHNIVTEGGSAVSIGAEDPTIWVADIRDVTVDDLSTTSTIAINVVGIVSDLTVANVKHSTAVNTPAVVNVTANTTLSNLVVDGVDSRATGTGGGIVRLAASTSTVTRAKIADVHYPTPGTSSYILNAVSGGVITAATLDKCSIIGAGGFVTMPSGTLTTLRIINCESSASSWVADLGTTTEIFCWGVTNPSATTGLINCRAASNLKLRGEGNVFTLGLTVAAGAVVTSYSSDYPYSATAGALPTVAVAAGAGTGATTSIVGSDRSGTITVTTGTGTAAGDMVSVTPTRTFPASIRQILITPTSASGGAVNPYVSTKSTNVWRIASQTAPAASTAHTFDYLVIV